MNTRACWQAVLNMKHCCIKAESIVNEAIQSENNTKPSLTQHKARQPQAGGACDLGKENILAADVTYLISQDRRATINMIKQKINWHKPANCSKYQKIIAHETPFLQVLCVNTSCWFICTDLHNVARMYTVLCYHFKHYKALREYYGQSSAYPSEPLQHVSCLVTVHRHKRGSGSSPFSATRYTFYPNVPAKDCFPDTLRLGHSSYAVPTYGCAV